MGKTFRSFTFDATKKDKDKFKASSNAEREFYKSLKKVARTSGHIVEAYTNGAEITDLKAMTKMLNEYSKQIEPWAARQSAKLLEQVSKSNKRAYRNQSKAMGKALELGVGQGETGRVAMRLLNEQVALIKSIPTEAGLRAQKIAAENYLKGARATVDPRVVSELLRQRRNDIDTHNEFAKLSGTKELEEEMSRSVEVAINRARLISRTETARANASFVQSRAQAVGVTHYIWRTTMDGAERESHAQMNGKVIAYSHSPVLSDGTKGHAGTFPNCRCYQDPVIDDE